MGRDETRRGRGRGRVSRVESSRVELGRVESSRVESSRVERAAERTRLPPAQPLPPVLAVGARPERGGSVRAKGDDRLGQVVVKP
jgi:hypothetical protein